MPQRTLERVPEPVLPLAVAAEVLALQRSRR
jgi:hypothetical protein